MSGSSGLTIDDADVKYALTFDDILLVPQYSEIVPTEISPKSEFARGRILNCDCRVGHRNR